MSTGRWAAGLPLPHPQVRELRLREGWELSWELVDPASEASPFLVIGALVRWP